MKRLSIIWVLLGLVTMGLQFGFYSWAFRAGSIHQEELNIAPTNAQALSKTFDFVLVFDNVDAPVKTTNDPNIQLLTEYSSNTLIDTKVRKNGVFSNIELRRKNRPAQISATLRFTSENTYQEIGTITFIDEQKSTINFRTEQGRDAVFAPQPEEVDGVQLYRGHAEFVITGGTGQFDGAKGYIVSNFTFTRAPTADNPKNFVISDLQLFRVLAPKRAN